jgi:hypothetical protein
LNGDFRNQFVETTVAFDTWIQDWIDLCSCCCLLDFWVMIRGANVLLFGAAGLDRSL